MANRKQASKGLKVVFLTAGGLPEVVAQIVAGAAIEIQSRHLANTFLDEMNEKLFKPRGLYAIVMSYKPDANKAISAGEFDPTATVARYNQSTGTRRDKTKQLRIKASGMQQRNFWAIMVIRGGKLGNCQPRSDGISWHGRICEKYSGTHRINYTSAKKKLDHLRRLTTQAHL